MSLLSKTMMICFLGMLLYFLITFDVTPKTLNHSQFGLAKLAFLC